MTWLEEYLDKRAKAREHVVKTFEDLLDGLRQRLYLSVTLVFDRRLALKAYANINSAGKPLAAPDVLKAYLVQDLSAVTTTRVPTEFATM